MRFCIAVDDLMELLYQKSSQLQLRLLHCWNQCRFVDVDRQWLLDGAGEYQVDGLVGWNELKNNNKYK
jgi:hypothetical protein